VGSAEAGGVALIVRQITYPPSANRLWRAVRGRQIKSAEYRQWLEANAAHALAWPRVVALDGHYALHVVATAPDKRRRDLDNLLKPIGDLIQHLGLVTDDKNMRRLTAEWGSAPSAGVQITIKPIGGSDDVNG